MRRIADHVVNALLRLAPWYRPEAIEAREARTEAVKHYSRQTRLRAEAVLDKRFDSYRRSHFG